MCRVINTWVIQGVGQFQIRNLPLSKNSKVKICNILFRRGQRKTLSFILCKPFKHVTHTTGGFWYILSSDFFYNMALELGWSSEMSGQGLMHQHSAGCPHLPQYCAAFGSQTWGDFLQMRPKTLPRWLQTVVLPPQCIPAEVSPGKQPAAALLHRHTPARLLPVCCFL